MKFWFRQGLLEGWFRVCVGFCFRVYVVLVWGLWMLGLGFFCFGSGLNYCFVRVCFGVGLGFVLVLVWGLLRVGLGLGFIQGRFRVYLGLV